MSGSQGWEDLASYTMDDADVADLLERQTECTLMWVNPVGEPVGVIVNYLFHDGSFWLTATSARPRVAAVRANPRVCIAISSKGSGIAARRSMSYKGLATVHEDAQTKAWFLPAFAARLRPGDPARAAAMVQSMDTPGRVVIEVRPTTGTSYDGAKGWGHRKDAAASDTDPTWVTAPTG